MPGYSGLFLIDHYQFAIVDLAALPDAAVPEGISVEKMVPELLAADADKMPGLINLSGLSSDGRAYLQANLEAGFEGKQQHLLSALLSSEASFDAPAMLRHLTRHLVLESPQGKAFLRYYDPRVFRHLAWILKPSQYRALFGPINRWTLCAPDAPRTMTAPPTATRSQTWHASAEQRQWLDRLGMVNETLRQIAHEYPEHKLSETQALEEVSRRILAAMDIAESQHGLTHENDLVAYATNALLRGDNTQKQDLTQAPAH